MSKSTGPTSGAYHAVAQQYAEHFSAAGLELVITRASRWPSSRAARPPSRRSGGGSWSRWRACTWPVWVFYRGAPGLGRLSQLAGKRIAIGAKGSGMRALALELLGASGALGEQLGYARRFRYLSPVTLPRGSLDLARDLPARDLRLVARKSVHPAVVALLTEAAVKTHHGGDLLSEPGTFPNATLTELPVNCERTCGSSISSSTSWAA